MVTAVSGALSHWSLLYSHLSAAFIEYGVVHALRYYRNFTAWMHASLVVISSIRWIAHSNLQLHVVSEQEMPISSAPLPTKDDVHAFLTRYPEAPKDPFHQTILPVRGTALSGKVHCETQLMALVDAKARGVFGIGHELSLKMPVCSHTSNLLYILLTAKFLLVKFSTSAYWY